MDMRDRLFRKIKVFGIKKLAIKAYAIITILLAVIMVTSTLAGAVGSVSTSTKTGVTGSTSGSSTSTTGSTGASSNDPNGGSDYVKSCCDPGENDPPVADAGGPYTGLVGVAVTFDGSGSYDPDGGIVSYQWNFGDGTTGSGEIVSHIYNSWGVFTVTLTVTDDFGEADTDQTTATVYQPPIADAGGPYSGKIGELIEFDGSGSSDPDGSIVSWLWNFGDGNTGSGQTTTHSYNYGGTYTITLTVTDDDGATDDDTTYAYINSPPIKPYNPVPDDDSINIEPNIILEWECGDPDGDSLTYDVYFDTISPPMDLVSNDQQGKTYTPEGLDFETQYYWKIVAKDSKSSETNGDIWSFTTKTEPVYIPDLECTGELRWEDVKPEITVYGSFTVENIGESGSELGWEIAEYPDWGIWTFTPDFGNGLGPDDDPLVVEVSVVAPVPSLYRNQEFNGEVKVVNSDDSNDYELIEVTMMIKTNKAVNINTSILNFIQNHSNLFLLLQKLLYILK